MKKALVVFFLFASVQSGVAQQYAIIDPKEHKFLNKEMPPFTGQTLDGKEFNLADSRGSITLLTFWSLTCGACFKEIEEINIIKRTFKDRNVVIVSIMPESREEVMKQIRVENGSYFLKKKAFFNDEIHYQVIPGMKEYILKCLVMETYPMMFILDEEGILKEFSWGYRASLFETTMEERENYKEMKEGIERLINK